MGDISISNGVRSNLMALQSTTRMIEDTQNRLATGKRVNSALDNPANFFTASAMNNRAGDLGSLLDSMNTGVNTIKAADNALSAITKLVESAQGTARQALQDATGEKEASIIGGTSIDGATSKVSGEAKTLVGDLGFDAGDSITVTTTKDGVPTESTISITATTTVKDLVEGINSGLGGKVDAEVTPDGKLSIAAKDGASLDLKVNDSSSGPTDNNLQDLFGTTATVNGTDGVAVQGAAGADVSTLLTAVSAAETAKTAADTTAALTDTAALQVIADTSDATALTATAVVDNDAYDAAVVAQTAAGGPGADAGADALVASTLVTKTASDTARDNAVADDAAVVSAQADDDAATAAATALTAAQTALSDGVTSDATSETVSVAAPTTDANGTREKLAAQFNDLLGQITDLAEDADFNGVNLLQGDDLKVTFNEKSGSAENSLTIKGVTLDANGLGLSNVSGDFQSDTDIEASLTQIKDSLTTLRQQASEFGSSLSVVETRQDFTSSMINTLEQGASDLTLADVNKEGAKMLALQTSQQLATTTMGIANRNDQAILSFLR